MMEFGLGFWILFFVIFLGCGKMCGWGARKYKQHQRELKKRDEEEDRLSQLESRVQRLDRGNRDRLPRAAVLRREDDRQLEGARLRRKRPTPLEELQKRFIEGRISLDEYERELDRLERLE